MPNRLRCTNCGANSRVTEKDAFGCDKLRSTLSCGHVVSKPESLVWTPGEGWVVTCQRLSAQN